MSVTSISAAPSVRFAMTARAIADATRSLQLVVPAFRTPPHTPGLTRAIRRSQPTGQRPGQHAGQRPDQQAEQQGVVVSVAVKGRTFGAVVADLIEGVVEANELSGGPAGQLRDHLWSMVSEPDIEGETDVASAA